MIFVILLYNVIYVVSQKPCEHPIYCQGQILHAVQTLSVFKDCKEFVDMPMKFSQEIIINNWNEQVLDKQNYTQVHKFVYDNFLPAGSDSIQVVSKDWKEYPKFLFHIKDPNLRQWGYEINKIWRNLSKRFIMDESSSSLLQCPYPFIIAGGRFREFYNWDTLWIIEGLILSEMMESAQMMLKNFIYFINKFGYVPNGARIYYLGRSQPPITTQVADLIIDRLLESNHQIEAMNLLKEIYPALLKEYNFFVNFRSLSSSEVFGEDNKYVDQYIKQNSIISQSVRLFQYKGNNLPRPESYREDLELADDININSEQLFINLRAACESGWDFSSRWFLNQYDIKTIRTIDIIPLDLNVFITLNERILNKFALYLGYSDEAEYYLNLAEQRTKILLTKFYNKLMNQWNDYIISDKILNSNYYPSNYMPLLLMEKNDPNYNIVRQELLRLVQNFQGGIPQSFFNNSQQWDYPNSWAPFNSILIKAVLHHDDYDLGFQIANNWIRNNYCSYIQSIEQYGEGYMFEKYNAVIIGKHGGGGEYEVQKGFGWSNGVVIQLLQKFGQKLKSNFTCK